TTPGFPSSSSRNPPSERRRYLLPSERRGRPPLPCSPNSSPTRRKCSIRGFPPQIEMLKIYPSFDISG
uniref:Uncharacterized protein n=1 Tax=Cucumis melo TaxID=3656 RepID=A0A9I9EDL9_CUCME